MKPEDLLDPANLPDDLQWLAAEHRLQPKDPVFLILAWHWHRVQKSEDAVRIATMEFKAVLDARLGSMAEATGTIEKLNVALGQLQEALERKPLGIAERLELELNAPIRAAVAELQRLQRTFTPLLQTAANARQQQAVAALVVGLILGATASAWLLL